MWANRKRFRAVTSSATPAEKPASAPFWVRTSAADARPGGRNPLSGLGQEVVDQRAHQCTDEFADEASEFELAIARADALHRLAGQRRAGEIVDREQFGAQAVVDIVVHIGDVVGQRQQPALPAKTSDVTSSGQRLSNEAIGPASGGLQRAVVLHQTFECFPGQVQPVEIGIAVFELGNEPKRMRVVIEAAEIQSRGVQRFFAGMAERRVAEIVGERQGFGEILVQRQNARETARDLRHLQRMRQPRAVIVAFVLHEDLRLVLEPAEGGGVDDAIAVALDSRCAWRFPLQGKDGHGWSRAASHRPLGLKEA